MNYRLNNAYPISGSSYTYKFVDYHRLHRKLPAKSKWIVPMQDEIQLCISMIQRNQICPKGYGYEIKLSNNNLDVIGYNQKQPKLYIGKFTQSNNEWHGYPADYQNNIQDKPHDSVLQTMKTNGLSKNDITRIKKGKPL